MTAYDTGTFGRITLILEQNGPNAPRRIWLENGAVHRLTVQTRTYLRVLRGTAWITHDGQDIIVQAGQDTLLAASPFNTLVSALGDSPLIFEAR